MGITWLFLKIGQARRPLLTTGLAAVCRTTAHQKVPTSRGLVQPAGGRRGRVLTRTALDSRPVDQNGREPSKPSDNLSPLTEGNTPNTASREAVDSGGGGEHAKHEKTAGDSPSLAATQVGAPTSTQVFAARTPSQTKLQRYAGSLKPIVTPWT